MDNERRELNFFSEKKMTTLKGIKSEQINIRII